MDDRSESATGAMARVVVGVDGSEASQSALVWALEEARLRQATLHVVHAWQYPFELAAGTYSVPVPAGEMKLWAQDVIDDALAAVEADPSVPILPETINGPATSVLLEAAKGAELLVVGTRGHNRLTGLFLGSVSQFLVVHAPCPVLVAHGPRTAHERAAPARPAATVPAPAAEQAPTSTVVPAVEEIPEDECIALLGGHSVGRLVVVHEGIPQAFPLNYVLDGRTVAVRTDPGTVLDWATLGHVAFEVDQIDEDAHEGWSVLVQGIGRDVTEGVDAWSERLRSRQLEPWAAGEKRHWVAVASPTITGRRIRRAHLDTPEPAHA
jgi:nucleotide-binding universal stress UspA family protein/nitroimidazol reductase NimA-like FMN-containing flavoprotein (pyridoxamine 5'-phosphate oxidase superfamily)